MGIPINTKKKMRNLTDTEKTFIYYGRYGEEIDVNQKSKSRFGWKLTPRMGRGIKSLRRRYAQTESDLAKEYYQKNMISKPCQSCNGHRLNQEALAVKINKVNISEFGNLSIREAKEFIKNLKLDDYQKKVAHDLLKEISERLSFLDNVGLHYLTLNRKANTLSGGEHQRIRLATQIGSGLTGALRTG